jgi:hypothetical protein
MSNTISEGEIVIKDELPEVEPIKIHNVPIKIEEVDDTEKIAFSIAENKLERFEISTLAEEEMPEDQEVFTCDCKLTFKTEWHLKRHLEGHDVKDYSCQICGKNFKNAGALKQHGFVHKEARDFQCEICEKGFKSPSSLRLHKHTVHNNEKPFKCSICGKGFKQKSGMKSHELIHSQPPEKRRRKRTKNSNNS